MISVEYMLAIREHEERIRKAEARYRLEGPIDAGQKRSASHEGLSIAKLVNSLMARF
jgi:hypothetical protein